MKETLRHHPLGSGYDGIRCLTLTRHVGIDSQLVSALHHVKSEDISSRKEI